MKQTLILSALIALSFTAKAQFTSGGSNQHRTQANRSSDGFRIEASLGYPFISTLSLGYESNKLFLGGGTGVLTTVDGGYSFPIIAQIRYKFMDTRISPYASLKTGYAFAISEDDIDAFDGFFVNPEFGAVFSLGNMFDLVAGIGYATGRTSYTLYNGSRSSLDTKWSNNFSTSVTLSIKL